MAGAVTAAPGSSAGVSRQSDIRAILVLAVTIPLGIAAEWAFSRTGAPLPALLRDLAVGWAFVAAGLVAWRRQGSSRTGTLMVAVGMSWFVANFQGSGVTPLFVVGVWLGALNEAVLVHLVLAFPSGRLASRAERAVVAAAYALAVGGGLAAVFINGPLYDPYRCQGCTAGVPLPEVGSRLDVLASHAGDAMGTLVGLAVVVLIVRRWVRSSGPARRALAPAWLSLGTCALLVGEHAWEATPVLPPPLIAAVAVWVSDILELAVPLGFLLVMLQMRMARAAVGELILDLGPDLSPAALGAALRRALGDPSLELGVWHEGSGEYRDAAGQPVALGGPGDRRAATRIDEGGLPLAVVLHDPALDGDPRLLEAVAAAARLSAEPQRLAARIAASADTARRRLERDLHDGAQQRLVLLALTLGSAQQQLGPLADGAGLRATLARAAEELNVTLGELRDLARGIHPAILTQGGLRAAVESVAADMPIPVDVAVTGGPWPPAVEATVYFLVSEALTNVVRHARATGARVTVEAAGGRLVVEVADDGAGGADPAHGSGLRGIGDRLAAVGGALCIESTAGGGTRIHAELPCA